MRKKRPLLTRESIKNSRLQNINNQSLLGTTESERFDPKYHTIEYSPVPSEKPPLEKLIELLKEWGAIFGGIIVIISFSVWCSSLKFSIDDANKTLDKHEADIDKNSDRISNLEISSAKTGKDIETLNEKESYLRKSLDKTDDKIDSINERAFSKKR